MPVLTPDDIRKGDDPPADTLYRVRDANPQDGKPVMVWGENLTYADANRLKERVVGAERSRTARLEDMVLPPPATQEIDLSFMVDAAPAPTREPELSPDIANAMALAAARGIARTAQARADAMAAQMATNSPITPPAGVPDTEIPDIDLGDGADPDLSDGEAADLDAADVAEYEAGGRELYEAYVAWFQRQPTPPDRLPSYLRGERQWSALDNADRAAFCFEALAKQGPHFNAIHAA